MKAFAAAATFVFAVTAGTASALCAEDVPPPWAWGFTTPPPPGTPRAVPAPPAALDDTTPLNVPGSNFHLPAPRSPIRSVQPTGSPRIIQRCLR